MDEALTGIFAASRGALPRARPRLRAAAEATVGVLVVGEDAAALEPTRADLAAALPRAARRGARRRPRDAEPALAEGLAGFLLAHRPPRPARRRHPGVRRPRPRRRAPS